MNCKKIIAAFTAAAMMAGLTACGNTVESDGAADHSAEKTASSTSDTLISIIKKR